VNTPPDRYAFGLMGRQGPGSYSSFASWLFSAGGKLVDFKTGEVFINDAKAVTALQFYVDLVLKHKVVPPEAMTWEFDEIIAGGQNDRYAITQTFAPYGTLINDPQLSKTAGRWPGRPCPATPVGRRAGLGSTAISFLFRNTRSIRTGPWSSFAWRAASNGCCVPWSAATRRRAARCFVIPQW